MEKFEKLIDLLNNLFKNEDFLISSIKVRIQNKCYKNFITCFKHGELYMNVEIRDCAIGFCVSPRSAYFVSYCLY